MIHNITILQSVTKLFGFHLRPVTAFKHLTVSVPEHCNRLLIGLYGSFTHLICPKPSIFLTTNTIMPHPALKYLMLYYLEESLVQASESNSNSPHLPVTTPHIPYFLDAHTFWFCPKGFMLFLVAIS